MKKDTMQKGKNKIVKIKQFYKKCNICNKAIKGTSEKQVEYNLRLHLEAHSKIQDKINQAKELK